MKNTSFILAVFISSLAMAGDLHFPAPTAETRPWGICHWLGNAVEPAELKKETVRWADAGMGGYRLIPIYGAKGYEDKYVKFMSPAFIDTLVAAKKIAADRDMKVDMSFGAGWCFGGTTVPKELGVWALVSLKNGDREPKNGKTLWEGEGCRLVTYPTGQAVKRAQDLDAGPMLNPYSPAALVAHLKLFKTLEGRPDAFPRATFHDSFEYFKAGWSEELPALFKKYRGYALEDHFAELAGVGDLETVARVKCDYRETLSDILVKETFPKWTAWCRERGIETHNQAHGAPANPLEFYAIADTPETEMFGRGKRDRFASGFDVRFREGDRSIFVSKFASSAAHLTGKRFTSAESFTWMGEHFCETLEEMKAFGDLLFLAGVNRLYYHAMVYSPDSAPWPGWCFYAASQLNPRNPLWRDMKPLNEYFTRVQTLTAAATPDNDVLLYWPIYDRWTQADGFALSHSAHNPDWLEDLPFGKLAKRLTAAGYQFDYTSDVFLTDEIVNRYKVIVVPETKYMKPTTLARLVEISKRMPVIFEKALPVSAPGLNGGTLTRPDGLAPVADALDALAKTAAEPVSFATAATGIDAVRYRWKGKKLYFVVNSSMKTVGLEVSEDAVILDPMPEGRVGASRSNAPETDRALTLAPAESVFVYGGTAHPMPPRSRENVDALGHGRVVNLGSWTFEFVRDVSGWELPVKREGDVLGDWTRFSDKEAEFSGTAVYRTSFVLSESEAGKPLTLKLGEVRHSARIIVNGKLAKTAFMYPYDAIIRGKAGTNTLEIEVTNLGANRIRAYDQKGVVWKTFRDANVVSYGYSGVLDAAKWPVLPSGLIGPVALSAEEGSVP